MREALKNIFGNEIRLEDGSIFYYTVQPFEISNFLGHEVAVLQQYSMTKKDSTETYNLYRTKDGNWYDIDNANPEGSSVILRQLKTALLNKEHAGS